LFQRNADIIGLATWAQTVNVLAPIISTEAGSFRQTVYTPLQAYRQYSQKNNLPIVVNSPEIENKLKIIDATASISDDKKEIVIAVLNLSENKHVKTTINFINLKNIRKFKLENQIIYSAPSLDATNTFKKDIVKETQIKSEINSKKEFELTFQPASINFLIFKMSDE
jgi:alpha-N-arabinofuranosidase